MKNFLAEFYIIDGVIRSGDWSAVKIGSHKWKIWVDQFAQTADLWVISDLIRLKELSSKNWFHYHKKFNEF